MGGVAVDDVVSGTCVDEDPDALVEDHSCQEHGASSLYP